MPSNKNSGQSKPGVIGSNEKSGGNKKANQERNKAREKHDKYESFRKHKK